MSSAGKSPESLSPFQNQGGRGGNLSGTVSPRSYSDFYLLPPSNERKSVPQTSTYRHLQPLSAETTRVLHQTRSPQHTAKAGNSIDWGDGAASTVLA